MISHMIPVWAFVAVTLPLVLTPGASTAIVLRNSLAGGVRAGLVTAAGVNAGSVFYGLLCAFGFAIALQRWPGVWLVLRVFGVGYLAWLGVKSLRRVFREDRAPMAAATSNAPREQLPVTTAQNLREGFVTNAANPAIATFYFVVVPQFIPPDVPVIRAALMLTAVHVGLALTWHIVWAAAGGTLSHVLATGRPRQILDLSAGIALIALAGRMAVG
jgi:threonine/homoserine/homoserine lactone efflux protein